MDKKIAHCLNFQTADVVILVGLPLSKTTEWSDDFEVLGIDPLVEDVRLEDGLDRHLPRLLVRAGLFPSTSAVRKFVPGKFTTPLLRDLVGSEFTFLKIGRKRAVLVVGDLPPDP